MMRSKSGRAVLVLASAVMILGLGGPGAARAAEPPPKPIQKQIVYAAMELSMRAPSQSATVSYGRAWQRCDRLDARRWRCRYRVQTPSERCVAHAGIDRRSWTWRPDRSTCPEEWFD